MKRLSGQQRKDYLDKINITMLSTIYKNSSESLIWQCNICGTIWQTSFGNIRSGKHCYKCYKNNRQGEEYNCIICNKVFKAINSKVKTCSPTCRSRLHSSLHRNISIEKICLKCGKEFITTLNFVKYCSSKCRKQNERLREKSILKCRLKVRIRDRVNKAIKGKLKPASITENLGCSWDELISYLEALFLPGMSWENYGLFGWHLDHIKPLDLFNLEDPIQFKEACHYTNLQPLWAIDNLKKGNKYE